MIAEIQKFFAVVKEQAPTDTRFNDAPYLAARFVVFLAQQYQRGGLPLNFISVGIVNHEYNEGYTYDIICASYNQPQLIGPKKKG
jgi:hypothetical protein